MSYDLAVWIGERPANDRAAAREYEERVNASEQSPRPTSDRIRAFVADLVARHPEGQEDGPWSVEPVLDEHSGDLAVLTVLVTGIERVEPDVRDLAQQHGLVGYDPQRESLLDSYSSSADERPLPSGADPPQQISLDTMARTLGIGSNNAGVYARRIGAGERLDFVQALTVGVMGSEEPVPDGTWLIVLATLRRWWEATPDLEQDHWLHIGADRAEVGSHDFDPIVTWEIAGLACVLINLG